MPVLLGFSDGKASWRAVANAQGYKIQLYKDGTAYGKVISVESDILNCDMMEYIDSKGVYTYTVTTIGDGKYYTDSDESAQSVGYNYEPELTLYSFRRRLKLNLKKVLQRGHLWRMQKSMS